MVQEEVPEVELLGGDLQDLSSLIAALEQVQPTRFTTLGRSVSCRSRFASRS